MLIWVDYYDVLPGEVASETTNEITDFPKFQIYTDPEGGADVELWRMNEVEDDAIFEGVFADMDGAKDRAAKWVETGGAP